LLKYSRSIAGSSPIGVDMECSARAALREENHHLMDGSLRALVAGVHAQSSAIVQSARVRSISLVVTNADVPYTTRSIGPNGSELSLVLFRVSPKLQ
jgi:hypothetical protein